jgi:hypothetical protein
LGMSRRFRGQRPGALACEEMIVIAEGKR